MISLENFTEIFEAKKLDNILDNTLMLSNFSDLYKILKKYIHKNYANPANIYLVFKNAEEAQSWVDFTYLPINGKKFTHLDGNYSINYDLWKKSKIFLEDVSNKNLLENIDTKVKDFPILEMTAFSNRIKIVFSNKMKVDKYNIIAYLVEI